MSNRRIQRCRPTHFLGLPLVSETLQSAVQDAQMKWTREYGLPADALIHTNKLHLTLSVMTLHSREAIQRLCDIMDGMRPEITAALEQRPLEVCIRGLDVLKGPPSRASVLYGVIHEPPPSLLKIQSLLQDRLFTEGFLDSLPSRPHLFHLTLVNTKSLSRFPAPPVKLDFTSIIQQDRQESYFNGGLARVNSVELFRMSSSSSARRTDRGYLSEYSLPL